MSSVLEMYDNLEKDIADELFEYLELTDNYSSLDDFLDSAVKNLDDENSLKIKYSTELKNIVTNKK
jgi:hypothetical protein